jgi:D-3-phosphoglycerate dehydrogenase
MKDWKIVVGTNPFGKEGRKMLKGLEVVYSPFERSVSSSKMIEVLAQENPDAIIAGIEIYNKEILDSCKDLKLIARVGIGVDSVDLEECQRRGIAVTNTPNAPSNAAAELTLGQMLNSLRKIQWTDRELRAGVWDRYVGRDLSQCSVGIIGYGRIGKLVSEKLEGFHPKVYLNDINLEQFSGTIRGEISSLDKILRNCDIVTLHIPLNEYNRNFISQKELALMKKDAILLNLSRGGIVNEEALYNWLNQNKSASAAVDSFVEEPYKGKLTELDNCFLTPHLGSCTVKSRYDMETGATKEILNMIDKKDYNSRVV